MASLVLISALVPAAAFMAPSLPGTLHGRARAAVLRPLPRQRKVESARGPALWTAVDSATLGELPVVIGALLGGDALHHVLPHFPLADAFDGHRDGILLAVDAASQARALHSSDPPIVLWHAVMAVCVPCGVARHAVSRQEPKVACLTRGGRVLRTQPASPPLSVPGKERHARGSERNQTAWQHVARTAPGLGAADTQDCLYLGGHVGCDPNLNSQTNSCGCLGPPQSG